MGQKISKRKIKVSKKKNSKKNEVAKVVEKVYKNPPGSYVVRAKYKYDATGETDISFDVGDIMFVLNAVNDDWLEVQMHNDNRKGYVPLNYVSKQDGSPKSVEAWREIQRWEAEKQLMKAGLRQGTYILRPSRKEKCFALSVRDYDEKKKLCIVKHFQIKTTEGDEGITYSINIRGFPDIPTLITYYEKIGIGNSHIPLTDPMPDNYTPPVRFQDIEISRDNIELLNEIGRGCFGSVYRAKWGRSYEVAAKMLQSNKMEKDKFLQEAKIMHKLRHRKIVELLGVCTEPRDMPIIILVEYMKHGSLKEYLKTSEGKKTPFQTMLQMLADITDGMAYLEDQNVVHRDLRADNILVAEDLSVKVADFGLTELLGDNSDDQERRNLRFPYKWTSPEAAKTKVFTTKSDVWSYGVVMYEVLTWASQPYPDIPAKEVIDKVSKGYRMPNPETVVKDAKCSDELYKIMLSCWNDEPGKRPTFHDLQGQMDSIIGTIAPESYQ